MIGPMPSVFVEQVHGQEAHLPVVREEDAVLAVRRAAKVQDERRLGRGQGEQREAEEVVLVFLAAVRVAVHAAVSAEAVVLNEDVVTTPLCAVVLPLMEVLHLDLAAVQPDLGVANVHHVRVLFVPRRHCHGPVPSHRKLVGIGARDHAEAPRLGPRVDLGGDYDDRSVQVTGTVPSRSVFLLLGDLAALAEAHCVVRLQAVEDGETRDAAHVAEAAGVGEVLGQVVEAGLGGVVHCGLSFADGLLRRLDDGAHCRCCPLLQHRRQRHRRPLCLRAGRLQRRHKRRRRHRQPLGLLARRARAQVADAVDGVLAGEEHVEEAVSGHRAGHGGAARGQQLEGRHQGVDLRAAAGRKRQGLAPGVIFALANCNLEAGSILEAHTRKEHGAETDRDASLQEGLLGQDLSGAGRQIQLDRVRPLVRAPQDREGVGTVQPLVPSEATFVGVQDEAHGLIHAHADLVAHKALRGVEVEDEQKLTALKGDDLVSLVLERDVLMLRTQEAVAVLAGVHELVEILKELIAQMVSIGKIPPAPTVLVAPVVRGRWKVDPLRVAKLVAHEVQVALSAQGQDEEPHHLVQRKPSVHAERVLGAVHDAHACVHLRVHQPEGQGLVADNGLVMGLAVADDLFLVAAVREDVDDVAHAPSAVRTLLQERDPHVGDGHGQAVVEAEATILDRATERGHAADVLADCHRTRHQRVNQIVGQHQVDVALDVSIAAEVLMVAAGVAFADAVRLVEH
mmetsp:Transcript_155367/g.498494  ORF Transcript_155367/g.498494 Transcript_155367/m.498494 type:complete len:736 (-) Transcript_155367:1057-3264(-)